MKYRPPTQLHASLYMGDKKSSVDSKVSKEAKAEKPVPNKKAYRAKK
jgi:hypothetical protein